MSGIGKTVKKIIPKELRTLNPLDSMLDSLKPKMPSQEDSAPIPMADEDEIRRNRRRSQSARGGGRASTILSDGDRLGP